LFNDERLPPCTRGFDLCHGLHTPRGLAWLALAIRQESKAQMNFSNLKHAVCSASVGSTVFAILSLLISGLAYREAAWPKDPKLTIKTDHQACFSDGTECSQLFIFANKGAPCFDFRLRFDEQQFKVVNLQNGYSKSGLLNAERNANGAHSFPAMETVNLKYGNRAAQGWMGFLAEETPVYIAFVPHNPKAIHKVTIHCAGHDEVVELKSQK
jgi:hypothetical protein